MSSFYKFKIVSKNFILYMSDTSQNPFKINHIYPELFRNQH